MQAFEQPLLLRRATLIAGAALAASAFAPSALGPSPAEPHPGHGPTFVAIGGFNFNPDPATVTIDDPIIWQWEGPDRNHSVTADDGSFDSDPGKTSGISHGSEDAFSQTFSVPGAYTYHCKVHTFMRGTIHVTGDPPSTPAGDTTAPAIERLRIKRGRRTAMVRVSFSEPVDFSLRIRRGKRTLSTHRYTTGAGATTLRVSIRKLKRGRHTVLVTARDKAGNKAPPAQATLRIP